METEVLEALHTLRSVRSFLGTPVEKEKIEAVLEAAAMAPSSGNSQPWEFVVATDPEVKSRVREPMLRTWGSMIRHFLRRLPEKTRRIYEEAGEMVKETGEVPVLIFACLDSSRASRTPEAKYASIYPAVQNLLLAAWAQGLGTCLTIHGSTPRRGEEEVKKILGIPNNVEVAACVYMGYPARSVTPPRRKPVGEVTHWNRW